LEIYGQEKRKVSWKQVQDLKERILSVVEVFDISPGEEEPGKEQTASQLLFPFSKTLSVTHLINHIYSYCFQSQLSSLVSFESAETSNHQEILSLLQLFLSLSSILCFMCHSLNHPIDNGRCNQSEEHDYMVRYHPGKRHWFLSLF
jgi:5'-3' exonuclease